MVFACIVIDVFLLFILGTRDRNVFLLNIFSDVDSFLSNILKNPNKLEGYQIQYRIKYIVGLVLAVICCILEFAYKTFIFGLVGEAIFVYAFICRAKYFALKMEVLSSSYFGYKVPRKLDKGMLVSIAEGEHVIKQLTAGSGQQIEWYTGPKLLYFEKSGPTTTITLYKHHIITAMNMPDKKGILDGYDDEIVYISDFNDVMHDTSISILDQLTNTYLDKSVISKDKFHYKSDEDEENIGGIYIRKTGNISLSISRKDVSGVNYATAIPGLEYIPAYAVGFLGKDVNKTVYKCGTNGEIVYPNNNSDYQLQPAYDYIRVEHNCTIGTGDVSLTVGNTMEFDIKLVLAVRTGDRDNIDRKELQSLTNLAKKPDSLTNFISVDCATTIQNRMNSSSELANGLTKGMIELNTMLAAHKEAIRKSDLLLAMLVTTKINEWYSAARSSVSKWVRDYINGLNNSIISYNVLAGVSVSSPNIENIIDLYNRQYEQIRDMAITPALQVQMITALKGTSPQAIKQISNAVQQFSAKPGNQTIVNSIQQKTTNKLIQPINTCKNNRTQLISALQQSLNGKHILDKVTRQPVTPESFVNSYLSVCLLDNRQPGKSDFNVWIKQQQNMYTIV